MGNFVIKDLGYGLIKNKLRNIANKSVKTGIHRDAGKTKRTSKQYFQVYAWNEFGNALVPARPTLRPTFDKELDNYVEQLDNGLTEIIHGNGTVDEVLKKVGKKHQDDISRAIVDIDSPVNADSTVKRKGFDNPLIETGKMATLIKYKVSNEK